MRIEVGVSDEMTEVFAREATAGMTLVGTTGRHGEEISDMTVVVTDTVARSEVGVESLAVSHTRIEEGLTRIAVVPIKIVEMTVEIHDMVDP